MTQYDFKVQAKDRRQKDIHFSIFADSKESAIEQATQLYDGFLYKYPQLIAERELGG